MSLLYRKEKCYVCNGLGNHKIIHHPFTIGSLQKESTVEYLTCWQCGGSGKIELIE